MILAYVIVTFASTGGDGTPDDAPCLLFAMSSAYTPPAGNAVSFVMSGTYTPPQAAGCDL